MLHVLVIVYLFDLVHILSPFCLSAAFSRASKQTLSAFDTSQNKVTHPHSCFDIKWNASFLRGRVPEYQCWWKYCSIQNEVPKPFLWVPVWISAELRLYKSNVGVWKYPSLMVQRTTGGGFKMQAFLLWDGFGRAGSSEAAPVSWLQKPRSVSGTRWGCSSPVLSPSSAVTLLLISLLGQ